MWYFDKYMANVKTELLKSVVLPDFPSGSSINYYNEKLYIVGDDANHILILDKDYQKIDSILLFDHPEKKIPKDEKTDLEASSFIHIKGEPYLLVLGSASKKKRKKVILVPFAEDALNFSGSQFYVHDSKEFIARLKLNGVEEVNLEGATVTGSNLLLGNRGNRANPENHLIITDKDFWERQQESALSVLRLVLPAGEERLGVSEMCYVESKNMLLLTLSSEGTDNAYDDGIIGNSHLGWANNITHKIDRSEIVLDGLIDLCSVHESFRNEKIEGVCVEATTGDDFILHLVSDNDCGESKLFKIRWAI
jgi:hypothetical protein